ncbi:hypothetical protein B7939_01095 [Eggerthia catenaformis]|nr:hypothetical protein B7939_01095 [Eggerthia catenaformis]
MNQLDHDLYVELPNLINRIFKQVTLPTTSSKEFELIKSQLKKVSEQEIEACTNTFYKLTSSKK